MFARTLLPLALFGLLSAAAERPGFHKVRSTTKRDCSPRSTQFTLADKYEGWNFFDSWDFFSASDPTNGLVNYLDASDAWNAGLVNTTANQASMKVDDTTWLSQGQPRNSVRISTKKTYGGGLFILDIDAMPYGCALWPAFWTVGPNWPEDGEIDIIEAVNGGTNNQMTLHTASGCTQSNNSPILGQVLSSTCDADVNSNSGCGILDPDSSSSGAGLQSAGGGVFAMLWDGSGVSIWHFARSDVPGDITSGSPSPGGWGEPKAQWSAGTCSPYTYLQQQTLVFDTTLCGDWAGNSYGSSGCPGTCATQVMNPNNFQTASWVINYVAVYNESS
ncbi:glycoside hydrolase family 16 protein [Calocera viscosa TUFC12733]|uniref:Glycoside hydrolase family 16 protein n=1 Tax=Calocera viscosa (strain TUFC12733) TaxID=1330018 RepID=A0A167S3L1_CALVF|nr:glycoside hydrolase family 16 protein [Calocera viscosa TUFC12733]